MAVLLMTTGVVAEITLAPGQRFTLADLQAYVGGYIEMVRAPGTQWLVLNEDGKRLRLPVNAAATLLYHAAGGVPTDMIVGDVLLATWEELGGNDEES